MSYELIYASNYEEFFYTEDDMPVSEGSPVGFETTVKDVGSPDTPSSIEVQFHLFDHIYWNPDSEYL
jgi:hypothetical protein